MAEPAFKYYDPTKPKRAANISYAEWATYRSFVEEMHARGLTRGQMLTRLCDEKNFRPSMSQLVSRLGKWDLVIHAIH